MNEVAYYPELAEYLEKTIKANLTNSSIIVKGLYLPEYGSQVRSFLSHYISQNKENVSESLKLFAQDVPKLRTDIVILLDNPSTNKFEMIIIEAKLLGSAGLTELSQLIGYSLVTKIKYGLLINIKGGASNELAHILETDLDLALVDRKLTDPPYEVIHKIGMMTYNPDTANLTSIETSSVKSLPQLVQEIESSIG
ncbi:MAG TPA: hypothetical protein VK502_02570 [Candidatus Saccharimonadales bacterium]|nr:hypothetical protein [Candidatus Saccharimonadales bacterium]